MRKNAHTYLLFLSILIWLAYSLPTYAAEISNVNITNICFSQCSFCNFCRKKGSADAYITSIDDYKTKVDELFALGGNQLLLQGGMNTELDLDFYIDLFRNLKKLYPSLKLHALGPPEVVYLSKKEQLS